VQRIVHAIAPLVAAALLWPQAAPAETIRVTIKSLAFVPAEVHAKVGDTIVWDNNDAFVHTATARNGSFDVNIPANKPTQLDLKQAGEIAYYCRFHPNMTGRLVVENR
jgi:plastocyanin